MPKAKQKRIPKVGEHWRSKQDGRGVLVLKVERLNVDHFYVRVKALTSGRESVICDFTRRYELLPEAERTSAIVTRLLNA